MGCLDVVFGVSTLVLGVNILASASGSGRVWSLGLSGSLHLCTYRLLNEVEVGMQLLLKPQSVWIDKLHPKRYQVNNCLTQRERGRLLSTECAGSQKCEGSLNFVSQCIHCPFKGTALNC